MGKIRRAGGGGFKIGDKVVYKDDPDEVGIVEGFDDGQVEVRWDGSPAISWEDGSDLIKHTDHERKYTV